MDATRFDSLARTLTTAPSRRTVLALTLGGTLVGLLTRLGLDEAVAKKKKRKKKLKRNEYGCVNVGGKCRGKDANCCSGRCLGKRSSKRHRDLTKCVAHHQLDCQAGADSCQGAAIACADGEGSCYQTTGQASFCGATGNCLACAKDADCEAQGFAPGAACVVCATDCAGTGNTACFETAFGS